MSTNWRDLAVNDKGYREGMDYSLAIRNATSQEEITALQKERQNKINDVYGGKDPYTTPTVNRVTGQATKPTNTASKYGSDWNPQSANLAQTQAYRDLQNRVDNIVQQQVPQQQVPQQQVPQQQVPQQQVPQQPAFDVEAIISQQQQAASAVTDKFTDYLDQWLADAKAHASQTTDYAVNQGVQELERAEADAQQQFQTQRNQIDIDEARAKDNQALYAERRGDKGGIGAAQYDAIMATAAQNRLQVNSAQQRLATDTARQIADLRAQGEFEKADALLDLSQQYLSQLISLEQWALNYGMSVAQFNASLQQWAADFEMQQAGLTGYYKGNPTLQYQQYQNNLAADQRQQLAATAEALLSAGIMPSASQLAALGFTEAQARDYLTAVQLAAASKSSGGGGGGGSTPAATVPALGTPEWYAWVGDQAAATGQSVGDYLYQNRSDLGLTATGVDTYLDGYNNWHSTGMQQDHFNASMSSLSMQLQSGKTEAALANVERMWPDLGGQQRQRLQQLLSTHGLAYNPEG